MSCDKLKFRIKTKSEFIEEFGVAWDVKIHKGWNDNMNRFFGQHITVKHNEKIVSLLCGFEKDGCIMDKEICDGWRISKDMIKQVV